MKKGTWTLGYIAITAALFLAFSIATERRAYGYVDPGSGLLVFQSASAIVTGALFYFRRALKSLLKRTPKPKPTEKPNS